MREKVLDGEVDLVYVSTEEQVADILTKPLPPAVFEKHIGALGMRCTSLITQK